MSEGTPDGGAQQALSACRVRIDEVDRAILHLLNERTRIVEEIGHVKHLAGLPVYEPRREDQVFLNVTENNGGPLTHEAARRIFERIIDEMRKVQRDRMESESCS